MHVELALATVAVLLVLVVAEGWLRARVYRRARPVLIQTRADAYRQLFTPEDRRMDAPARARALGFHDLERDELADYAEYGGEVRR